VAAKEREQPKGAEQEQLLRDLKRSFADAESMGAISSFYLDELDVIPINQLRYAGFHLLAAHNPSKNELDTEELKKAINHCRRAHCDAMHSVADYLIKACLDFTKMYQGKVEVFEIIPDYNDKLVDMNEASSLLFDFQIRLKDAEPYDEIDPYNLSLRESQIPKMQPYIDRLRKIQQVFAVSAPQISALLQNKRDVEKRNEMYVRIGIYVTALAVVAQFILWLLQKYYP